MICSLQLRLLINEFSSSISKVIRGEKDLEVLLKFQDK